MFVEVADDVAADLAFLVKSLFCCGMYLKLVFSSTRKGNELTALIVATFILKYYSTLQRLVVNLVASFLLTYFVLNHYS